MKRMRINGELFWVPDGVEPGVPLRFRRVDELDGIPVVEVVGTASAAPHFSFGPGNTGSRGLDPQLEGEKWNEMVENQPQVQSRPLIGRIPKDVDDDVLLAQTLVQDPDDIPVVRDDDVDFEEAMRPSEDWHEAEVEDCREVGGLLLLTLGGRSYLVVYDDECRRAGMGPGARIRYRVMPQRSTTVPGVGRMDVDEIQLGTVLIPAGIGSGRAKNIL